MDKKFELASLVAKLESELKSTKKELLKVCDHRMPSGKSAWSTWDDGREKRKECLICGKTEWA